MRLVMNMTIHKSSEDYLEAMLMLKQERGYIRSVDVADRLGVTRQAVLSEVERQRKQRLKSARKREARDGARPALTAQPTQRGIRYDDPRSARAEEGLIRLLYLDPGLARGRELPDPSAFTSPLLGRFYAELLRRTQAGERISTGVLAGMFTQEEMSHFTAVLDGTEDLSNGDKAMDDYIQIIVGSGQEQDEDLRVLAEKYRKTKSYGG